MRPTRRLRRATGRWRGLLEALALCAPVVFVYAEEATPDLYADVFPDPQAGCAVALRLTPCADGEVEAVFRHAAMPPAGVEALVDFLAGRRATFATSDVVLTRTEPSR